MSSHAGPSRKKKKATPPPQVPVLFASWGLLQTIWELIRPWASMWDNSVRLRDVETFDIVRALLRPIVSLLLSLNLLSI